MSVARSGLLHEHSRDDAPSVAAMVYPDEAFPDAAFRSLVGHCRAQGLSLAGVLQHLVSADADHRCDVLLEDLNSGHRTVAAGGLMSYGVQRCQGLSHST